MDLAAFVPRVLYLREKRLSIPIGEEDVWVRPIALWTP
jgi:hypothetical protein